MGRGQRAGSVSSLASWEDPDRSRDPTVMRNVLLVALLVLLAAPLWARPTDLKFQQAVRRGDHRQVDLMLAQGYDPLSRDVNGDTAAHAAAAGGQRAMLKKFLDLGVPVDALNHQDHSLLYEAAVADSAECCRLLLARGASQEATGVCWSPFRAALIWGRSEAALVLLNAGADPHTPFSDGETPLIVAAGRGPAKVMKALLAAGADPTTRDKDGRSALHHAARGGNAECVRTLLSLGLEPLKADDTGVTPLELAYQTGSSPAVRLLLDSAPAQEALPTVLSRGNLEQVRELLSRGAKPRPGDLITAARRTELGDSLARLLLENGAAWNWDSAQTSLQVACRAENVDMVGFLLLQGVDPNRADKAGDYPLLVACGSGHLEIVRLLLESGADPTVTGPDQAGALARIQGSIEGLEARLQHLGRYRCVHPLERPTRERLQRLRSNSQPIRNLLQASR